MTHPDPEVLAAVALDDPTGSTAEQAGHVSGCASCGAAVAQLRQVRDQLAAGARGMPLEQPPTSVWARVREAQLAGERRGGGSDRSRRPWLLAGSAAAALALGFGLGWVTRGSPSESDPVSPVTATVARARLDAPDSGAWQGSAEVVREVGVDSLRVTVTAADAGPGYLEVWLLNRDGHRMVSLGVLHPGGTTSFPLNAQLLDRGYVTVDVSREAFDDLPDHSGDSLARGTLAG